jgi:hypothetical protein
MLRGAVTRASLSRSEVETDPSAAVTPVGGTPPVGKRATQGPIGGVEVDLVPTMPERKTPDIQAIMSQARQNLQKGRPSVETKLAPLPLAEVTSPARPIPLMPDELLPLTPPMSQDAMTPEALPAMTARARPANLVESGEVLAAPPAAVTAIVPAPTKAVRSKPRGSRWPWVVLILMLLPIGGVAAAIELLPPESPVRIQLLTAVGPLLDKVEQLRR